MGNLNRLGCPGGRAIQWHCILVGVPFLSQEQSIPSTMYHQLLGRDWYRSPGKQSSRGCSATAFLRSQRLPRNSLEDGHSHTGAQHLKSPWPRAFPPELCRSFGGRWLEGGAERRELGGDPHSCVRTQNSILAYPWPKAQHMGYAPVLPLQSTIFPI